MCKSKTLCKDRGSGSRCWRSHTRNPTRASATSTKSHTHAHGTTQMGSDEGKEEITVGLLLCSEVRGGAGGLLPWWMVAAAAAPLGRGRLAKVLAPQRRRPVRRGGKAKTDGGRGERGVGDAQRLGSRGRRMDRSRGRGRGERGSGVDKGARLSGTGRIGIGSLQDGWMGSHCRWGPATVLDGLLDSTKGWPAPRPQAKQSYLQHVS